MKKRRADGWTSDTSAETSSGYFAFAGFDGLDYSRRLAILGFLDRDNSPSLGISTDLTCTHFRFSYTGHHCPPRSGGARVGESGHTQPDSIMILAIRASLSGV